MTRYKLQVRVIDQWGREYPKATAFFSLALEAQGYEDRGAWTADQGVCLDKKDGPEMRARPCEYLAVPSGRWAFGPDKSKVDGHRGGYIRVAKVPQNVERDYEKWMVIYEVMSLYGLPPVFSLGVSQKGTGFISEKGPDSPGFDLLWQCYAVERDIRRGKAG
jgi:hypothetical protein